MLCVAITLTTGRQCINQAKFGDYCGKHENYEQKRCKWVIKKTNGETEKCIGPLKIGDYCKRHFEYIEAQKKRNGKYECFMELYKEETVVYTQEEYQEILKVETLVAFEKEKALKFREQMKDNTRYDRFIVSEMKYFNEWNFEKNLGLDITKMTKGSKKKAWWICNNREHPTYFAQINIRTKGDSNCHECFMESKGKPKRKREMMRNMINSRQLDKIQDTTTTGDETENFVLNIILEKFKAEKIGHISGKGDIEIVLDNGEKRYIQVKTLSKDKNRPDIYTMNLKSYKPNMLIVAVNTDRNGFLLCFYEKFQHIKSKSVSLSLNPQKTLKYKDIIHTDLESFKKKLFEMIPFSVNTNNVESASNRKEISSLSRLEKKCAEHGLLFERNETNGNAVDGFINKKRIQAKFRSQNHGKMFKIDIAKNGGIFEGKPTKSAYQENDFDFLIVEVGGFEKDSNYYYNNFCIIPIVEMSKHGLLRTDESNGKFSFGVCPPDADFPHWTADFWNNYDLLK